MSIVSWWYFTAKNIQLKERYANSQAGTIVRLVALGQVISTPRFGFTLIFMFTKRLIAQGKLDKFLTNLKT